MYIQINNRLLEAHVCAKRNIHTLYIEGLQRIHFLQSWVWAYRGIWLTLVINTNNGVEAQNKVFKYEYLTSYREATITRLMQCLIEEYFVDQYRK